MKGRPVEQLIYDCMFPKPKSGDPQNFHDLLRRHLVPEVRSETACFYGGLDSREAQYPGLDYSYPPHRARLARFTWHRRLFRAIDTLKLTPSEIAGLTKWEGTRWAKERFEKEQGIKIRDTTGDCIHDWVDPELRQQAQSLPQAQDGEVPEVRDVEEEEDTEDMDEDGDESDMDIDSVGLELNERLRAAAALRDAGNSTTVMDEEWEQWLKDAAEAGGIPPLANQMLPRPHSNVSGQSSSTLIPARLLNAARPGQWDQSPDFLPPMGRHNIEANHDRRAPNPSGTTTLPSYREMFPESSSHSSRSATNNIPTSPPRNPELQSIAPIPASRRTSFSRPHPALPSSILSGTQRTSRWAQRYQQQPQP